MKLAARDRLVSTVALSLRWMSLTIDRSTRWYSYQLLLDNPHRLVSDPHRSRSPPPPLRLHPRQPALGSRSMVSVLPASSPPRKPPCLKHKAGYRHEPRSGAAWNRFDGRRQGL